MKMRVADYLTAKLHEAGGEHVFLVAGGMIMHLTDALLRHPEQQHVCCHHEQAAVMAAEAYGRRTGRLGVAYVTAGPGALNTLTGVVGAFVDSAPCIVVSGQSKVAQATVRGPRQFALQGFDTLPIFERVTKYAVMLDDVSRVRYEVEKCIHLATTGRVGPVWIESPIDVQGMLFDPDEHEGYVPEPEPALGAAELEAAVEATVEALRRSERPCLLVGAGVRAAAATAELAELAERTGIPVLTSRLGMDLLPAGTPELVGRPGTYGDRAANFTVQACDLLLSVGCRLALGLVGHDYDGFAQNAYRISVDVDRAELEKPSVRPHLPIHADARDFLRSLLERLGDWQMRNDAWRARTRDWRDRYPTDLPEYEDEPDGINSYRFFRHLSEVARPDDDFVVDTGSCFHAFAQTFAVKEGQRHVITGGLSTMGYLPASVGVAMASGRRTICVTGDGSLQMNIQELQTIAHHRLPVKIVVLSNSGYLLIRITQRNFQGGRLIGTDEASGLSCPDLERIAGAYDIPFARITGEGDVEAGLAALDGVGPVILEVLTPSDQLLQPRVGSVQLEDGTMVSLAYDDMVPQLPREEYAAQKELDAPVEVA